MMPTGKRDQSWIGAIQRHSHFSVCNLEPTDEHRLIWHKHQTQASIVTEVHLKQSSYKLRLMGEAHPSNPTLGEKCLSPTWTVEHSRGIGQVLHHNCRNVFSSTWLHCRKAVGHPSHTARSKKDTFLASHHHLLLWLC